MQMWFFMLFIAIVLPFIMFMSSFYFIAGGPKNINNIFLKFILIITPPEIFILYTYYSIPI